MSWNNVIPGCVFFESVALAEAGVICASCWKKEEQEEKGRFLCEECRENGIHFIDERPDENS